MGALTIRQVRKTYAQTEILKGIDIDIDKGEFLILVGPSGCGKSTLLNMIAGLEEVSSGEISIGDKVVNHLSPKDRDIAMVFQSYALYPNMSVKKNISFGLEIRKVPAAEQAEIVNRVADMLQIKHLLDRKPSQLSGGQRQRVAMGRALARNPQLFLFDEPLSNLDAKLRVEMRSEIKMLHKRTGITTVYVTHDQIEAMTLGDKIAVMKDGAVQQFGSPQDIYDQPSNMFVAGFIGSPSMNFIRCAVHAQGEAWAVQIQQKQADGQISSHLLPVRHTSLQAWVGQEVIMGIRPEQITDAQTAHHSGDGVQVLPCIVQLTEPTGPDTLIFIELNQTKVVCRSHPKEAGALGQSMNLAFDMSKTVFFDPKTENRIRG